MRPALLLLSAASLAFEIDLTRLFSVAQFYHFAFLIVSLALLGFGASGTALALLPDLGHRNPRHSLGWLALACSLSLLGSYLLTNWMPFDSFSVVWDRRQALILIAHFLALAAPFFFSGMAVGLLLSAYPQSAGQTYAVNLAGAALGCLTALVAPAKLGGEGLVVLCAWLAALAALVADGVFPRPARRRSMSLYLPTMALLAFGLLDIGLRLSGGPPFPLLELRLSPYKGLSYALQYPGASVIYRRWNAFSRVDVVSSGGVHSLPGLSYLSPLPPPQEHGLLVDGDDLSPVVLPGAGATPVLREAEGFADYMPGAVAYRLRPGAEALILEPRGGLDVLIALALGARRVIVVEANPLIVEAAGWSYADPRVQVVIESDRSYLRRVGEQFDVVVLSLASSYHPVRSGAYSLAEDYRYTVEAFAEALGRLKPDGMLVVTRWLQTPPSEELRAFGLAVSAVERAGEDPATDIIAFRGYNTATLLVKRRTFAPAEVDSVRAFAARRAFDLIYAPGIRPEETNEHNILPETIYYETFTALLTANPRARWYADYPFDVTPPTDDRPFFGQYFRWSQLGQLTAELGKTWQPFGGAGYLVLLALLGVATVMAAALILLPMLAARWRARESRPRHGAVPGGLLYFGLIGMAFLLVEVPLVQHFILFLGNPAYALTVVLFALLLFSGIGSQVADRLWWRGMLAAVALLVLGLGWLLPGLFSVALGLPLWLRSLAAIAVLAPLGFLMGTPLPLGLRWLEREAPGLIPWAWGVNGAASVVASILAALLALSFGFRWVLAAGALCYGGAWLTALRLPPALARSPDR